MPHSSAADASLLTLSNSGYKFEVLSVLHKPWDPTTRAEIEGRQDEVVNNSAQYCSVVKTGMGNVRMVLGGEVDAGMFFLVFLDSSPFYPFIIFYSTPALLCSARLCSLHP